MASLSSAGRATEGPLTSRLNRRRLLQLGVVGLVPACAGRDPPLPENPEEPDVARITPNDEFYVVYYNEVPTVDAALWRLTIDGLASPAVLALADIEALGLREKEHTLQCIGASPRNLAIGNAIWSGLPLHELLERVSVDVDDSARFLHLRSADAYLNQLDRSDLDDGRIWLVTRMNGEPLPAEHGFPARLLVSGRYGFKNPKWLERITFAEEPIVGTWQELGYPDDASNRPAGFVHAPGFAEELRNAPFTLVGSANCGDIAITSVELSIDEGATWEPAEIVLRDVPDVWTLWRFAFTPPRPGDYIFLVRVRAADGRESLPENPEDNGGWQGYGRVSVRIV